MIFKYYFKKYFIWFIQGEKGDKGERGLTTTLKGDQFPTGIIEGPPGPPGPPGRVTIVFGFFSVDMKVNDFVVCMIFFCENG